MASIGIVATGFVADFYLRSLETNFAVSETCRDPGFPDYCETSFADAWALDALAAEKGLAFASVPRTVRGQAALRGGLIGISPDGRLARSDAGFAPHLTDVILAIQTAGDGTAIPAMPSRTPTTIPIPRAARHDPG